MSDKKTKKKPIPKRRKPGTQRTDKEELFVKGGKPGPGRGNSKSNAAIDAVVKRVEDAYEGKLPPGPREVMRMILSDPGMSGQMFMATLLQKPSTMPQLLQAIDALDQSGYTPEDQRETVQIITRFPLEGSAESDFTHAALVERAESAEKRVGSLELECERLRDLLEDMSEGGGGNAVAGDAGFSDKGPKVSDGQQDGDVDGLEDGTPQTGQPGDSDDSPDQWSDVGFLTV